MEHLNPFGNMLTAQENSLSVFSKTYTAGNRISDFNYDTRGNLTQDGNFVQAWDKRNRMTESRTATNALLGSYVYNERGLRVKAERSGQPIVQVVAPNGGESLYMGAMGTISWNGMGLVGSLVKLELLVGGAVAGTIAENLPGTQTSFQWQVGKTLTGTVNPGSDYKVRVTAMVPILTSGTTYYFYDSGGKLLSEYDGTGACVKDYLYLGGKMIGEYLPATSSYYYYASDQINSTRFVTDGTGVVVHSAQYDPYGGLYKTWIDTYHPKPGFSGKEREFGSEMDYFGARYYGHKQYRFISVDPILNKEETITNPQLWNLYTYCRNNPIGYYDPDGCAEGAFYYLPIKKISGISRNHTFARSFQANLIHNEESQKYNLKFKLIIQSDLLLNGRRDQKQHEIAHLILNAVVFSDVMELLKSRESIVYHTKSGAEWTIESIKASIERMFRDKEIPIITGDHNSDINEAAKNPEIQKKASKVLGQQIINTYNENTKKLNE
jgi:RHS repeat-associated protein